MGRSFIMDKSLVHPKHSWKYVKTSVYDWGVSVQFSCANSGCKTGKHIPVKPDEDVLGSLCFDTDRATEIQEEE